MYPAPDPSQLLTDGQRVSAPGLLVEVNSPLGIGLCWVDTSGCDTLWLHHLLLARGLGFPALDILCSRTLMVISMAALVNAGWSL